MGRGRQLQKPILVLDTYHRKGYITLWVITLWVTVCACNIIISYFKMQDKPQEHNISYSSFYFVGAAVIASLEQPHFFKWIVPFRYTRGVSK